MNCNNCEYLNNCIERGIIVDKKYRCSDLYFCYKEYAINRHSSTVDASVIDINVLWGGNPPREMQELVYICNQLNDEE